MRFIFCLALVLFSNQTISATEVDDEADTADAVEVSAPRTVVSTYTPTPEQQCTRVDLRGDRCANGSNRLPALRSQGMTNYCFAYATTEIISYATCSNLSALSAGLIANIHNSEPLKNISNPINLGGNPRNLLRTLRAYGPCLESAFPSSPLAIRPDERPKNSPAPSPSGFDFLMGFYNRRNSPNPLGCESQSIGSVAFNDALPAAEQITNTDLQLALNAALNSNVPAGVHVDSSVALDNAVPPATRPALVGTNHYVNVVGRQWINGHCHYMFRDQYPMTDSPWPRVDAHPNEAPSTLPSHQFFYIWVREENLLNHSDDVIYNAN